jgi:hypothetical protein
MALDFVCFWASRIPYSDVRIRILLSSRKLVRKTLIPTVLRLLFDFLSLKNDVNVVSKSNMQDGNKKLFFFWFIILLFEATFTSFFKDKKS